MRSVLRGLALLGIWHLGVLVLDQVGKLPDIWSVSAGLSMVAVLIGRVENWSEILKMVLGFIFISSFFGIYGAYWLPVPLGSLLLVYAYLLPEAFLTSADSGELPE